MINPPVLDLKTVKQIVARTMPALCTATFDDNGVNITNGGRVARVTKIGEVFVHDKSWEPNLASLIEAIWHARIARLPVAA